LIEAWASQKSFQRKDGTDGDGRQFCGESRSDETHASTIDPGAPLYWRSHHGEAKLSYIGHLLIENRQGLITDACATRADGFAEREAGLWMSCPRRRRWPISSVRAVK